MAEGITAFEYARRNVGIRRAAQAFAFVTEWAMVRDELGREPSIEEYAEWWKVSRRSAFYQQARFREAFPKETTPSRLIDLASAQWDARKGPASLGSVVLT